MTHARFARPLAAGCLVLLVGLLRPPPASAAPPSVERVWGRGGGSAPYELATFTHPAAGEAVFAAGYTGGVAAVGRGGPLWRWGAGDTQMAGAAFGDVTGDGVADAIVGRYEREVTVLDGVDGRPLADRGFASVPQGVAVGDADGDGRADVYIVTQGTTAGNNLVTLLDGDLEETWSVDLGVSQRYVLAADAADLDGDGRDDLVFGTYSDGPRVYAFGSDGTQRWEADLGGAILDLFVADAGARVLAASTAGTLASIDAGTGEIRWSIPAPSTSGFSDLAVADLDGDGADDAAWALYGATGKSASHQVLAVDGETGALLWAQPTVAPPKSVVTGDLDGDGAPDVATTTQDVGPGLEGPNFVWAYDGATGLPLWSHPVAGEQTTFLSDLTLADVAGDSRREVVAAPYFNTLLGLDGADGSRVWTMPVGSGVTSAVVGDLDGDGAQEAVEGGGDFRVIARDASTGAVRWSRDLGAQVFQVSTVPSGTGRDVLAIALSTVFRLRGADGAVRWSTPLPGMGTMMELIPQDEAPPLLAVGARARRTPRGFGSDLNGGFLLVLDTESGRPLWTLPSQGAPWRLASADLNEDGAQDLASAVTGPAPALTVYDGAGLETAPSPLWQTPLDGAAGGLFVAGTDVVTVRHGVDAIVAQDGATGEERWRRPLGAAVTPLGTGDVDADGTPDILVATEVFAERIAAVGGSTGEVLFDVPAGIRFVKTAAWTDLTGDGEGDLLFGSDGGTFGAGGVFAVDGTTLDGQDPAVAWSYRDVNAYGLERVPLDSGEGWLAYGFTVRRDAIALLRPIPGS